MRKNSILFLFILLIVSYSFSQENNVIRFKHIYASDIGVKTLIHQTWDAEGNLWGVSDKGLIKYNGYQAEVFSTVKNGKNILVEDKVAGLSRTSGTELWITYQNTSALTKLNPITEEYTHYIADSLAANSLPLAQIVKVVKDSKDRIWICTWGDGLVSLNEQTAQFTKHEFPSKVGADDSPMYVKEFLELKDGRFLVCFFNEGGGDRSWPVFYNPDTGDYSQLDVNNATDQINLEAIRSKVEIAMRIVHFAYEDKNENIWFGTYSGLIFYDSKTAKLSRVTAEGEENLQANLENTRNFVAQGDFLWIGTPNRGVMLVNMNNRRVRFFQRDLKNESSLVDTRVYTLGKDPMNNVWVSTGSGNLSVFVPSIQHFDIHEWSMMNTEYSNRSAQQIPVNFMRALPSGELLLSHDRGIQVYDAERQTVKSLIKPNSVDFADNVNWSRVDQFRVVGNKMPMILNFRPAVYYKKENKMKFFYYDHRGFKLLFSQDTSYNRIIFSQGGKEYSDLLEYKEDSDTLEIIHKFQKGFGLNERFSFALSNGNWLLSTYYGRFVIYKPDTKESALYSPSQSESYFPDSTINCAIQNTADEMFFGTSKGIYSFDVNTGDYEFLNNKIGLDTSENIVSFIRGAESKLWITTGTELLSWDEKENSLLRYGKEFGIDVGAFLPFQPQMDASGRLYFATQFGLLDFHPDDIQLPNDELKLSLSSIDLNDELVSDSLTSIVRGGDHIFHWEENFITFAFSTNQVFALTPHKFEYRLLGQSKKWIDNGVSNKIRFANLPHGEYELEVKVKNTFGIQSDVFNIPFSIKKPYWLSAWFYVMFGLLALTFIVGYIKYRERALNKKKEILEKTVIERTAEAVEEKNKADVLRKEAELQKEIVEEKQQEITDSINYAKRIQEAILPSDEEFKSHIPNSFVMYRPKDIVAGDFYWMHVNDQNKDEIIFAAADCTGHGVPGAMVSVVCNNALNRAVREFNISDPGKLLDKTRDIVVEQFEKSQQKDIESDLTIKDGMDISLCVLDFSTNKLRWSGANNSLWIVREGELLQYKGDRQPVGKHEPSTSFITHDIELKSADVLYIFSDGYADQFGGENLPDGKEGGKKFKKSELRKLLLKISPEPMSEQLIILEKTFDDWKGSYEQLDDVCVIGVLV